MTHLYTCYHCRAPIDRHEQVRVVHTDGKTLFYHVTPDCKRIADRQAQWNADRLASMTDHEEWDDLGYN